MTVPSHPLRNPYSLARYLALAYAALIVFVSLQPFEGWRLPSEPLWSFLSAGKPRFIIYLYFDLGTNFVAYFPLGLLLVAGLRQRLSDTVAILLATFLGAALSVGMETAQMLLPSRISSNLDVFTNTTGTLVGAMAAVIADRVVGVEWLLVRRYFWFRDDRLADVGLVLLGLWFFTQINPSVPWFGVVVMPDTLERSLNAVNPADLEWFRLVEAAGAMFNLLAVGLFTAVLLAPERSLARPILGIAGLALLIKMITAGALLKPQAFFEWINLSICVGLVWGGVLLLATARLRARQRIVAAVLAIGATLLIVENWPVRFNPVTLLQLFSWRHGQLLNFSRLSHAIATLWPFLALGFLVACWRYQTDEAPPPLDRNTVQKILP